MGMYYYLPESNCYSLSESSFFSIIGRSQSSIVTSFIDTILTGTKIHVLSRIESPSLLLAERARVIAHLE